VDTELPQFSSPPHHVPHTPIGATIRRAVITYLVPHPRLLTDFLSIPPSPPPPLSRSARQRAFPDVPSATALTTTRILRPVLDEQKSFSKSYSAIVAGAVSLSSHRHVVPKLPLLVGVRDRGGPFEPILPVHYY
jgi:hypothetical protein